MNKLPRFAGLISVILAAVIIMGVYLLVGSVDLAFVDDGNQIAYVEDVKILSDIEIPAEVDEGLEFTYVSGEETKDFADKGGFKFNIARTLVENLFTFKWEERDYVITLTAK